MPWIDGHVWPFALTGGRETFRHESGGVRTERIRPQRVTGTCGYRSRADRSDSRTGSRAPCDSRQAADESRISFNASGMRWRNFQRNGCGPGLGVNGVSISHVIIS